MNYIWPIIITHLNTSFVFYPETFSQKAKQPLLLTWTAKPTHKPGGHENALSKILMKFLSHPGQKTSLGWEVKRCQETETNPVSYNT